jgi:hypothetical protein
MRIDPAALPRLGQGRIAEVFALEAERALKLAREPGPAAPFEREAAALRLPPSPEACIRRDRAPEVGQGLLGGRLSALHGRARCPASL